MRTTPPSTGRRRTGRVRRVRSHGTTIKFGRAECCGFGEETSSKREGEKKRLRREGMGEKKTMNIPRKVS